jgi:hypothetical protein
MEGVEEEPTILPDGLPVLLPGTLTGFVRLAPGDGLEELPHAAEKDEALRVRQRLLPGFRLLRDGRKESLVHGIDAECQVVRVLSFVAHGVTIGTVRADVHFFAISVHGAARLLCRCGVKD